MPSFSSLKGIHSLKSAQSIRKNNESETDLIKLYMLEKERVRLINEKQRIEQRQEFIERRLKEIGEYFEDALKRK